VGAPESVGRLQTRAEPLVARVHVDVPALDREFDYLVPDKVRDSIHVGTIVRVPLHGRRVRGWVTALGVERQPDLKLQPIAKVTGMGPSADVIALGGWAAWRWAGRKTTFLRAASPDRAVGGVPPPRPAGVAALAVAQPLADEALDRQRAVLRLSPAADRFPVIEAALQRGPALLLTASASDAVNLARRLRRSGRPVALMPHEWALAAAGGVSVVGTRAAAWAPGPDLASVVVLDGHDDAHVEERAPTWNAWVVAAERARRAGIPCVVVSPTPSLELLAWAPVVAPSRTEERSGWPPLVVVDRRSDDPRSGLYSHRLVTAVREDQRAVCVLNRKGRATLLACAACGELAACDRCGASTAQGDDGLRCRRCDATRPAVCLACGRERMKQLRVGVTRAREELEALVGEPVGEITADTDSVPDTRVVVGTEAALHRVSAADVVAFLDFDQELFAPRFTAYEHAFALLARAGRIVGGRNRGGSVLVQTRSPRHDVIVAALHADPAHASESDSRLRQELGLPPFSAMALASGDGAAEFLQGVRGLEVHGPTDGMWQLRARDHDSLCDALAEAPRPPGRLRVEVDPRRA
jgi:primosomal protein N' (replication factor Y) (superfamily II helicase)